MKINRLAIYTLSLGAFALVLAGCGGNKTESTEAPASAPAANAPAGKTVDPATAGELTGTVKLDGAAPKMKTISTAAEPACGKSRTTPLTSEEVVTGDGGSLANVVVYIKSGLDGYSFPAPSTPVKFTQEGCQYHPHVAGMMVAQNVDVINSDQTTHNIHPIPMENREWNESQPPGAAPIEKSFAREEVAIPVKCNVHPWMKAYMAVLPNPYFQVTDKDGKFDLKNLPPGTYTVVAWHELYKTDPQTITIGPKESKSVNFTFKATASGD
ncbi:MAG: carboxypeptidase regulatory-like domain-containing protein [Acidobacteriia bacterium]|nr:carboxypeptidase regulatory-like domain-containing protein [Terriglobia bacterium]